MAPKKLTDCPENLREAIDWLIQVRYGNGGNKGLDELAKALKKLIEEAIEKAYHSICPDEKGTSTSSSTSPPSSTASASSASSNGWTDKITKKIKELNKQLDDLNNLKKAKNGYLTEKDSKSLDSLPTQLTSLETVHKLAEFADQLDTKNSKNDNILTHLCDGLETFLGFNPSSKGYDGSGIVYSDLDRLCDGVMAFLSGILSNIHSHLGQHKRQITDAINILRENKHGGKNGFNVAIGKVVEGVGGYNERVRKGNDKVKEPIQKLLESVDYGFVSGINALLPDGSDKDAPYVENASAFAPELVTKCLRNAEIFENEMNVAHNDIWNLDGKLRDDVMIAKKNVIHERRRLQKLAKKERNDMEETVSLIQLTLKTLKESMGEQISICINNLILKLRDKVMKIRDVLNDVYKLLMEYANKLSEWMKNSKVFISNVKRNYVDRIANLETGRANKDRIAATSEEINDWRGMLEKYLENMKKEIGENVRLALLNVVKMNDMVKDGLGQVKMHIQTAMERYVRQYLMEVQKKIESIKDGEKGANHGKGLEGTRKRIVEDYVARFKVGGEEGFEGVVCEWLTHILRSTPVIAALGQYINKNKNAGLSDVFKDGEGITPVAKKIAAELKQEMTTAVNAGRDLFSESNSDNEIANYLIAVKAVCDAFAKALEEHVRKGQKEFGEYSQKIAGDISDAIPQSSTPVGHQNDLAYAIRLMMHQLIGASRQAGSEVESFAGADDSRNGAIGKNVEQALKVVKLLEKGFDEALKQSQDISTGAKVYVPDSDYIDLETNISKTIDGILMKQVGAAESYKQSVVLNTVHFTQYYTYIKQSNLDSLKLGKLEGDQQSALLPKAIKKIEADASAYDVKATEQKLEKWSTEIKQNLNMLTKAISDTAAFINGHLDDFKNVNINNSLKPIKRSIEALQSTLLHGPIQHANTFINSEAPTLEKETIQNLQNALNYQVEEATMVIAHHARTNYVTTIQLILKQFAFKVTTELHALPDVIDRDLTVGYKGFMKDLYGDESGSNIQRLQKVTNNEDISVLSFAFNSFSTALQYYLHQEITRRHDEENRKKNPSLPKTSDPYASKLTAVYTALGNVLKHITDRNYYDHKLPGLLDELMNAVNGLTPRDFADPNTAILDGIRVGLAEFVNEMRKVYINMYDGATPVDKWEMEDPKKKKNATPKDAAENMILTKDGKNCAKVFLTAVYMWYQQLHELYYNGGIDWKTYKIESEDKNHNNSLQLFLNKSGFKIKSLRPLLTGLGVTGKLFKGFNKYGEFNKHPSELKPFEKYLDYFSKHEGILSNLFGYVETYNEVGHISTFTAKRRPCSINEMLVWCSGLPYNAVHSSMVGETLSGLFEDPSKTEADADDLDISFTDMSNASLEASPKPITYDDALTAVTHICSKSYDVLATVVGTGDADTIYGSDFCNNAFNLHYPSNPADCFDMLLDILRRMFPVFNYLQRQCKLSSEHHGWSDCRYGKDIPTAKSHCDKQSTDKPTCQPTCEAKCEATCKVNCQVNCQPTSPLMSYLNDCLPGHLPHQLSNVGCKSECSTCPSASRKGMPCLTPLGFRAFSGSTKTGRDICDIIEEFFYQVESTSLFGLIPKPPKTLAEHFNFSLSLARQWQMDGTQKLKTKIHSSIDSVSISLCTAPHVFTSTISNVYGSSQSDHGVFHPSAKSADVSSLAMQIKCSNNQCAPYLYSLYDDVYSHIALKTSGACLSWALYLPWDFHNYLQNLLKTFKDIFCQDWGCRGCLRGDSCKKGSHGDEISPCHCSSIVDCKGVSSTLYNYGFAFGNATTLCAKQSTKTCANFCDQLNKVINSKYFTRLFEECDNFLWTIRTPFSYLVLALWLLSLLYLIHIMVIRLDLLHIKSHLHSPSSHRIAAQSLLAAARVGKLSKISYLQA